MPKQGAVLAYAPLYPFPKEEKWVFVVGDLLANSVYARTEVIQHPRVWHGQHPLENVNLAVPDVDRLLLEYEAPVLSDAREHNLIK